MLKRLHFQVNSEQFLPILILKHQFQRTKTEKRFHSHVAKTLSIRLFAKLLMHPD